MEKLGGLDAAFVYLESRLMPLHMAGMLIYDASTAPGGRVDYDAILENLASRTGSARTLQHRLFRVPLDLDRPWWVEDGPVDLRYHIGRIALPGSADWRELWAQVARFLERPLDMDRPLWEMLLVEGLHNVEGLPEGAFAMVFKVHHSAMDGVSGVGFLGAIHDQQPAYQLADANLPTKKYESPSSVGLLVKALPELIRNPWRILNVAAGLGPSVARRVLKNGADVESDAAQVTPKTRFDGAIGSRRTVGGVRFELSDIKRIKKAIPGATVNDVVIALIGGALRQYLSNLGELPSASLIAGMPVSLRSEEAPGGSGNQLTLVTIPVGSDIADPVERVLNVHEVASSRKTIKHGEGAGRLVEIADAVPSGLMGLAGRIMAQIDISDKISLFNLQVTNVPGPSAPMYMTGAKALDLYGLGVVASGIGVVNMVSSYCNSLTVGFQCGSEIITDPQFYEQCLRDSFDDLLGVVARSNAGAERHSAVEGRPSGRTRRTTDASRKVRDATRTTSGGAQE